MTLLAQTIRAVNEAPLLRIAELGLTRAGILRPALDAFSLDLARGESVVLMGGPGCGSDAVMEVLCGRAARGDRVAGTLTFAGCLPQSAGHPFARGPVVAYMPGPASHPFSPHATVLSQLVRILARHLRVSRASARVDLAQALARMAGAPGMATLDDLPGRIGADVMAWGLVAQAMAQAPELVLVERLHEGLSPHKMGCLAGALRAEQARLGFSLLYAATGREVAEVLGARVIALRHGRVVEEGALLSFPGTAARAPGLALPRLALPRLARRGEPVLQVTGLRLRPPRGPWWGRRRRLNLELRRGAALALIGEEGSGRRALVRMLIGLDRPAPVRIRFDSVEIAVLSEALLARLRRRVAYITGYDEALDPRMTVWDMVEEPLRAHLGTPRKVAAAHREAALKLVGLGDLPTGYRIADLTAFDKRRLQIARAIVTRPLLTILDEPFLGLDGFAQSVVTDLLRAFRAEELPALLVVTSDAAVARVFADAALVFEGGHIVAQEAVAELLPASATAAPGGVIEGFRRSA